MPVSGCRWRSRVGCWDSPSRVTRKWLKQPVSAREAEERELIAVLHQLHDDDPEGGYRVLADDITELGYTLSERRVWRLCRVAGIQSVFTTLKPGSTDGRRRERHQTGAMAGRAREGRPGRLVSVAGAASAPGWGRVAGGNRWIRA